MASSNRRYSLRAFAQRIGVDSSTLSRLFSGKRAVTKDMFDKIADRIGLDPEQRAPFRSSIADYNSRIDEKYRLLSQDTYRLIADWYHFAILELMKTGQFKSDPRRIAKQLKISVPQVNSALERLKRVGFLTQNKKGQWIESAGSTTNAEPHEVTAANSQLQLQLMQKATEAIQDVPFSKRDQSSMILAVDPKKIKEVRRRIDRFRRELTEYLEKDKSRSAVYSILISFFPLTQISETQERQNA